MKNYTVIIATIFILAFGHSCTSESISKDYRTKKVVVLVVDGLRYSENWGEPNQQYIPNMRDEMAEEGFLFTNFRNNGSTHTNGGHTAILTGHYQSINNSGWEIPQRPNFLNYWLQSGERHSKDAWLITSKDKLAPLADSQDPDWNGTYLPSLDCGVSGMGTGYRGDSITVLHALDTMGRYHPSMVLINLRQPDFNGHTGNWEAYLDAIRQADQHYFQIWNFIRTNPFYKDQTAFFIVMEMIVRGADEYNCMPTDLILPKIKSVKRPMNKLIFQPLLRK